MRFSRKIAPEIKPRQNFITKKRFREDENKVYEMKTLLQISTDNFDKGSRGKKHKRLMNELYRRYNV